ncbi:hypothetical protein L9F63_005133, partial [Diploptera punctata]
RHMWARKLHSISKIMRPRVRRHLRKDAYMSIQGGGWVDGLSPDTKDSTPEIEDVEDITTTIVSPIGRSKTKKEQRSGNTLYQELSFQDAEALGEMDEGADITGSWVHPGEYASSVNDNFFGMGKEVENLIMENNELLATKNALNIVKDDLIVKVDELTSEQEILREEIKSLAAVKTKLGQRIQELEEELKRVREEAEHATKASKSDDEEDVPMAQRKRFTRVNGSGVDGKKSVQRKIYGTSRSSSLDRNDPSKSQ